MNIIVCGGRDYADYRIVSSIMRRYINSNNIITYVFHGNAPGADTLAMKWCLWNNFNVKAFPANWHKFGKAAGPIRNKEMLDYADILAVIAFPGRDGTANMVSQAMARDIPIVKVSKTGKITLL